MIFRKLLKYRADWLCQYMKSFWLVHSDQCI